MEYKGYDLSGILRLSLNASGTPMDIFDQGCLIAREYMREAKTCKKIVFRPVGKNGRPMLQGSFSIARQKE